MGGGYVEINLCKVSITVIKIFLNVAESGHDKPD